MPASIWFAYQADYSGFAFFHDEIDALRYAIDHGMQVREVDEGDIIKQLTGEPKPRRKEQPNDGSGNRESATTNSNGSSSDREARTGQGGQPARDPSQGPTREEQLLAAEAEGFPPQTGKPAPGDGPASFPDGSEINRIR